MNLIFFFHLFTFYAAICHWSTNEKVLANNGCPLQERPEASHNYRLVIKTVHIFGRRCAFSSCIVGLKQILKVLVTLRHRAVKTWPCHTGVEKKKASNGHATFVWNRWRQTDPLWKQWEQRTPPSNVDLVKFFFFFLNRGCQACSQSFYRFSRPQQVQLWCVHERSLQTWKQMHAALT